MHRWVLPWLALSAWTLADCSPGDRDQTDGGDCQKTCTVHEDCTRGTYCAAGCCREGCAFDADCVEGVCDPATHQCTSASDGGVDAGGDAGADAGTDAGGDSGGDDVQPGTKELGEACEDSAECAPANPYCFADVLRDPGGTYCTISFESADCSGQVCPTGYECNDFYVAADPPQPPFCARCLGTAAEMGGECLCGSDCTASLECFRRLDAAEGEMPLCTLTGCTVGEGDPCPGTFECSISFDIAGGTAVNYCKACAPGDHSLADGAECDCHKDCPVGSQCQKDPLSQDPKTCVACLGPPARGFGEACECDSDCNTDFPTCLVRSKYCSVLGCTENPSLCPTGSHCRDLFGFASFCEKD